MPLSPHDGFSIPHRARGVKERDIHSRRERPAFGDGGFNTGGPHPSTGNANHAFENLNLRPVGLLAQRLQTSSNTMIEHAMPIFLFTVQVNPASQVELKEVAAPDFVKAVQTLAAWRPGIHILKLEGVYTHSPAHA